MSPLSEALGLEGEKEAVVMLRFVIRKIPVVAAAVAATLGCWTGQAAQPEKPARRQPIVVAQSIDFEVLRTLKAKKLPVSPEADDAEFLRRSFIDISGRIPTRERAVAFHDSKDPDKRRQLIDELLDSPHFGESIANEWRDLIDNSEVDGLHRKYVTPFRNWLAQGFNENRGWDRIVTDLVTAQGEADKNPATFFVLANMTMGQPDAGQLTASATRLFLGIDLACARCHDHLQDNAWKHQDFWRLAAFFGHVRDDGKVGDAGMVAKAPVIIEGDGPSKGKNNDGRPYYAPPKGAVIDIPDPKDPKKLLEKVEARFLNGTSPHLSSELPIRPHLAKWLTSPQNPYFARAFVNRLWYHFFGSGLVNPVDGMNATRQPSHPEVLDLLAREFVASGMDVKHLVRCICNSQTYQRTCRPLPGNRDDAEWYSHNSLRIMSPSVLRASLQIVGVGMDQRTARRYEELFQRADNPRELAYSIPHFMQLSLIVAGKPKGTTEDLYLSVLSRRPLPAELKRFSKLDPSDLFGALLSSAEFIHY